MDVKTKFLGNSLYKGARSIKYEIVAEDIFGHETKKYVGSYYLDAVYHCADINNTEFKWENQEKFQVWTMANCTSRVCRLYFVL